ncbi:MAG TPA: DUF1549 domain-containing protein, partial [Gemmataceae bacterium]
MPRLFLTLTLVAAMTPPAFAEEVWWSFRPSTHPTPPKVTSAVRNPIDAFILAKLAEKGLSPSPEADRRTLIRRLTFDLIGL